MYQVTKRDGTIADFDLTKISRAITKAFEACYFAQYFVDKWPDGWPAKSRRQVIKPGCNKQGAGGDLSAPCLQHMGKKFLINQ